MQTPGIDELEREREERQPGRKSQATELVDLTEDFEFVHDGDRAYVIVTLGDHHEVYAVKSPATRSLLRHRYWRKHEKAPNAEAITSAIGVLEAKALFDGREQRVHLRVAGLADRIVLDLADPQWRGVIITADGWQVVATPPVPMRRTRGMLPLPVPEPGGTIDELKHFVNVASNDDFVLLVSWLVSALSGRGPFPIVVLHGEQGSGKSTTSKALRGLVDPNKAPTRAEPGDPRDLMIAANAGHVIGLDNLSHLQPWLSDGLCRLSTGGGFSTRELYTDEDEIIFEARRPLLLAGIEELATRADLLDRSLILYLPRLREPRDEATFWLSYEAARPRILGSLLDGLVSALRNWDAARLVRAPRMADFARLVVAAEPGLGWTADTFITAYVNNRESANSLAIEASAIAESIRAVTLPWNGTAAELLTILNDMVGDNMKRARGWPSSPKALSNALRRIAPNLRELGIEITFVRKAHTGRRLIYLTTPEMADSSSPSSPSSPSPENRDFFGDDRVVPSPVSSPLPSPEKTPEIRDKFAQGDGGDGGDDTFPPPSEADWESIQ